ncbi:MAG: hypothetical protein NC201_06785 [Prevotella sp.]|nr:hypothetical protein [Bacteroides sp.]MCM1366933.1 hypothetical protein [Prevotella sp.]MCM1437464.1 hypothetical protein [Prevotella sp.]
MEKNEIRIELKRVLEAVGVRVMEWMHFSRGRYVLPVLDSEKWEMCRSYVMDAVLDLWTDYEAWLEVSLSEDEMECVVVSRYDCDERMLRTLGVELCHELELRLMRHYSGYAGDLIRADTELEAERSRESLLMLMLAMERRA